MSRFETGKIVCTNGVGTLADRDEKFATFAKESVNKYKQCDWGDTCKEDAKSNDEAVENGERILAVYKMPNTEITIWIITEWDRSVTTILFPNEY
jgi:hypothetical protein